MDKQLVLVLLLFLLVVVLFSLNSEPQSQVSELKELPVGVPDDQWYQSEVADSPVPVLVEFTASWCSYCRMLEDELHELAEKYQGRLKIVQLDVDEHPELAAYFRVNAVPVLMLVVDGEVVGGAAGFATADAISRFIEPHLAPATAASIR